MSKSYLTKIKRYVSSKTKGEEPLREQQNPAPRKPTVVASLIFLFGNIWIWESGMIKFKK